MRHAIVLTLLCAVAGLGAGPPGVYAIRDARIVTAAGPVLERGTVLIRGGLIEQAGANLAIPADAWVIDGQGLTVYPGLIDALSTLGLPEAAPAPATTPSRFSRTTPTPPSAPRVTPPSEAAPPAAGGPDDRPSNTSWLRAADMISPTDRRIEAARSAGFTAAVTFPQRGIFAGQGAVIALAGEKPGEMVIETPAGLYCSMRSDSFSSFPGSLMGVMAYVRQTWLDAEHYKLAQLHYPRNSSREKRPAYDRAIEGMLNAPRVLLPASRAVEIDRMLRFAAELRLKPVLYGGHEAHRSAAALKKAGVPVLVSLRWPERSREADPDQVESMRTLEFRERAPSTPAALAKEGVRFAFYSDGAAAPRDTVRAVKRAIDAGLSPAGAIRALTLSAAEIYGVADRLGSIDKGKIANLIVTDGDLFGEKTRVKYVFIDGVKYEPLPEAAPSEEVTR